MQDTIMWDWPTLDDAERVVAQLSEPERTLVASLERDVPAGGLPYEVLCDWHGQDTVDRLLWGGVLRWTLQGRWGVRLSGLGRLCAYRGPSRQERLDAALTRVVRKRPWDRKLDTREYTWYCVVEAARDRNLSIDDVSSAYEALHADRERVVAWDRDTPRRGGGQIRGDLCTVATEMALKTDGEHCLGDWALAIAGVGKYGYVPHEPWPCNWGSLDDVRVARHDPDTVSGGPELPPKR